ncbi:MAG: radical SAM protein [Victivallales bacterium]|nr:radical SAM protein [Victivallales bacterium]
MKYREPLYRPPSEADSLIFQVAYGCPHNTCSFCPMYKGTKYYERPLKDILKDIKEMASGDPYISRIFLGDGDALFLSFPKLEAIFDSLNKNFTKLARISIYANASSILSKTEKQLKWLKDNKLFTLYMGLESGDDTILEKVKKNENSSDMVRAVELAQNCGVRMSVMVLIGLGGSRYSYQHSLKTAEAVNKMNPRFLAALRFINPPDNKVYDNYNPVSEYDAVVELRNFIENLNLKNTVFRANHASNPVPIAARFPKDKRRLLNELEFMLKNNNLNKENTGYIPYWL